MGFSIDGVRSRFANQVSLGAAESKEIFKGNKDGQFDKILITSNGAQIEEKKIAEQLKSRVMSEVNQLTSEGKIEELRNSVSKGTYRIDTDELAGRIMLQRGDSDK